MDKIMFITSIKLKGFKRIAHNNIKELYIDFTSPFQVILGRNGSGKSSIMGELTPYPSHKDSYSSDGYRELSFTNKGDSYKVIDDFSTNKHSLEKNGVVVNENLNPTMMKSLVKELFGIDKTLVDILTDKVSFTSMSASDRREIIMRASGINLDLGMDILSKIRENRSYFKEHSKNLSRMLVAEDNRLPSDSHLESLIKRKSDILADLEILEHMTNQPVNLITEKEMLSKIDSIQRDGLKSAYRHMDTPEVLSNVQDITEAMAVVASLKNKLEEVNERKCEIETQINDIPDQLKRLESDKTIDELNSELEYLSGERCAMNKSSSGFIYMGSDYRHAMETAQTLYEELRSTIDRMVDNSESRFNHEDKIKASETIIKLNNRKNFLETERADLNSHLKRVRETEEVTCDKCNNVFIPGTTLNVGDIETLLDDVEVELNLVNRSLSETKEYEMGYIKYVDGLSAVASLRKHFAIHYKLFDALDNYDYISNSPEGCKPILEDWFNDIGKSPKYNELVERISSVKANALMVSESDEAKVAEARRTLNKLNGQYSDQVDITNNIKHNIKIANEYIEHIKARRTWLDKALTLEGEVNEYKSNFVRNGVHKFVSTAKIDLNNELANIEKEMTNIQYAHLNRERINKDREATNENIDYLNILHDELSPKTGLLGDVMNEFIDKFVTRMNGIIKSIWTYDMKILPCRNKKGDLDFYFPVSVMGREPANDVSELSVGEQHVCNFAFKLLIMSTYDIKDYPLYLDELAGNMDDVHRVKIMKTVYDMVINKYCSQMFLIAHYQQQYGVFTQAQVFIVNSENLQSIPENYNTHAKFN